MASATERIHSFGGVLRNGLGDDEHRRTKFASQLESEDRDWMPAPRGCQVSTWFDPNLNGEGLESYLTMESSGLYIGIPSSPPSIPPPSKISPPF